jgi:Flp pilus assembly protein TadB
VAGYGFKLAGAAIAFLFIGVLVILIFDRIWFRIGMGTALVVVFGGLLLVAWYLDRKEKAKRAGIDELPRV